MIEDLLPVCYGRLNLKTSEIEELTIAEVDAYIAGWEQRYYDLQDLFIMYAALPTYQTQCKKPPKYEDFVKNRGDRRRSNDFSGMSYEELLAFASDDELQSDG